VALSKRAICIAVLSLAVAAGLAAVATSALGTAVPPPRGYTNDGSRANRAAARRDAPALLAKVQLPPGARRLGSEPPGDHGYLRPGQVLEGDLAHAVAHAWWEVPETESELIAYVKAHPPPGGTVSWTGGAGNVHTGTTALTVSFGLPAVPDVLGYREVAVTATALPGGNAGVLIESQSDWVVLRPISERIPATTRELDVTAGAPGGPPAIALTVTRPAVVRQVVRVINALPIAQPVVINCPALFDPRLIAITFRAAGATGAPLAVLTYDDFRPWSGPSVGCKTVVLTIGGRRRDPLVGGYFLRSLEHILGRRLT
jgi:hypothetical protein